MKYRSRADIIDAILRSVGAGSSKTRIMYKAYVSYGQAEEYLSFLLEKGMIFREPETQLFKLSTKGLQFMHAYDEISELIPLPQQEDNYLKGKAVVEDKKMEWSKENFWERGEWLFEDDLRECDDIRR